LEKLDGKKDDENKQPIRYCFFDVETTQDERVIVNGVKVNFCGKFDEK